MKPYVLHVEVVQKIDSVLPANVLSNCLERELQGQGVQPGALLTISSNKVLLNNAETVRICEQANEYDTRVVIGGDCELHAHIFKLFEGGAESVSFDNGDGESICAAHHWRLPSCELHGLWDQLIFESNIKKDMLNYMEMSFLFSELCVNSNVITWNRLILLHGPPGTGKTSLCKALAHKLAIRLSQKYSQGHLFEVNSHSLLSKWFSQSGKHVIKVFSKVKEFAENPNAFVVVLIDEVESLTYLREHKGGSTEPSDSIRAVNAVLTSIDILKRYPNILILATSNIVGTIDLAFVDRVDINQYIGPPPPGGIYFILKTCISELMRVGIISSDKEIYSYHSMQELILQGFNFESVERFTSSLKLLSITKECEGLSGRVLRKQPFLAHAKYLQAPCCSLEVFLDALMEAVIEHKREISNISNKQ